MNIISLLFLFFSHFCNAYKQNPLLQDESNISYLQMKENNSGNDAPAFRKTISINLFDYLIKNSSIFLGTHLPLDHDPSDDRHIGDLFLVRGKNIHSLVWAIDLLENCKINEVIGKINCCNRKKYKNCLQFSQYLVLLKRLLPFGNTYLVAHPYFRIFSKLFRKNRRKYHRSLITKNQQYFIDNNILDRRKQLDTLRNLDNTSTVNFGISSDSYTTQAQKRSKVNGVSLLHNVLPNSKLEIFLTIEDCISAILRKHPCVVLTNQEVLRKRTKRRGHISSQYVRKETAHSKSNEHLNIDLPITDHKKRSKRAKPQFNDPLYKDQWHLVSE